MYRKRIKERWKLHSGQDLLQWSQEESYKKKLKI